MDESQERPLVSYVLATYNRPDDLADAIDSILEQDYRPIEIIVISSSTDRTGSFFEDGGRFDRDCIEYCYTDRMGPAQARNIGYERASGEIVVTIDDDAVIAEPETTGRIVSQFERDEGVGALAFQSRSYQTGDIVRMEIPDPPDFRTPPSEPYRTTSFIGVGTAIRRSTLEAAGAFPDDFVYGFEEMDLSMRILDAGYDIIYDPALVVYHKKSPEGRRPETEELELQVENRIRIAIRNLPWRYVLFTAIIWSAYLLVRTGMNVESVPRTFRRLFEQRRALLDERDVLDGRTIALMKSRSSMLFGWWFGPHPRRIFGPGGDLGRLGW